MESKNDKFVKDVDVKGMVDSASDRRTVNNVMRHEYRVLNDQEKQRMQALKDAGDDFYRLITSIESNGGSSRELSVAKTKIEEAVMWAVKHITK
jgi:cell division protein FtsL